MGATDRRDDETLPLSTTGYTAGSEVRSDSLATPPAELPRPVGRYVPLRPHARGGLGEVYVARDEELGREVALKAIQDRHADDHSNRTRFVREAEITGNLEHPGIVPVYGMGRSLDGRPYYAMRFIEGESLATAIDRFHALDRATRDPGERSMALLQLLKRFNGVCDAISYAHSRGVLHRDLKPSNIMLGPHGETLVVDWGLAKCTGEPSLEGSATICPLAVVPSTSSDQTLPGSTVGTPAFMSPEQASGRLDELGPASDIYNLGATLYYLLSGQPPFDHEPVGVLMSMVQRGDFVAPSAVAPGPVSPALEAICLKAMALRPQDRYHSPRALADDIERWIADEPVSAYPEGAFSRLARWARHHRTWVFSAATVLLGLLVVLTGAMVVVHRAWQHEQSVRLQAQQLAAGLDFDKALSLCERGSTARGILRMAHALRITPAGEADMRRTILTSLDAWRAPMSRLREALFHPDAVWAVACSPDGRTIASGSSMVVSGKLVGEARLWDVVTGAPIGAPMKHDSYVAAVAFSPDGKQLLTGGSDRLARLWDARTGEPLNKPLEHRDPVAAVAFAADGRTFLTAAGRSVRLWDARTLQPIAALADQPVEVYTAAFSPSGTLIAIGCADGTIQLWDAAGRAPEAGPAMRHDSAVNCVAFSPDGKTLATGDEDGVGGIWNVATRQRLAARPAHHSEIYGIAFSPDGKILVTVSEDDTARCWDAASGRALGAPMEHLGSVTAVSFAPDGKSLVTGCGDSAVRVWDTPTGRPLLASAKPGGRVLSLAYSPNGQTVLTSGSDRRAQAWDANGLQPAGPALAHQSEVRAVAFSHDGALFVTGGSDGIAQLWRGSTQQPIGHPFRLPGPVAAVSFRPDGRAFLVGGDATSAHLWDPFAGRELGPPLPLDSEVTALAFSPDGQTIATAEARSARLWHVQDGAPTGTVRQVLRGHKGFIYCLAFSRDGRLLATGSEDNTVRLWDVATGRPVGSPLSHGASVLAVAFHPDGRTILTGCHDQTARLWSVATSRPIGPHFEHQGRVTAVAFNPRGGSFMTGSYDCTIRLWEMPRPWPDEPEQITERVQALTGMALSETIDSPSLTGLRDRRSWQLERPGAGGSAAPPSRSTPEPAAYRQSR